MNSLEILHPVNSLFNGALGAEWSAYTVRYDKIEYIFYYEKSGNRVIVSDEGYSSPSAPVGEILEELISVVRDLGLLAGVVITPYALTHFSGNATAEMIIDYAKKADFVAIDPYLITKEITVEMLLAFVRDALNIAEYLGKPITLVKQGFAVPGLLEETIVYNSTLRSFPFDEVVVADAYDFPDIPDDWQLAQKTLDIGFDVWTLF